MIAYDELLLSDGTTTIDLLSLTTPTGVHLSAWRAGASRYKDGGYWHNSAIAPGRRPAMHMWDAVEERMVLNVVGWTPNDLERQTSAVRNLLQQAWDYFDANLPQSIPVYLIRRVQGEAAANREYSLVLGGLEPEDVDYLGVQSEYGTVSFNGWEITIWREEHWRDTVPAGTLTCAENSGYGETIQHIGFDPDEPTHIRIPAGAGLNNLPQATITVEAWIRIPLIPDVPGELTIASKCAVGPLNGWVFWWDATNGLNAQITAPGNDAWTYATLGFLAADNVWHHVAFTFSDAADNWPHLWIDGVERSTTTQNKGAAVDADAASDMYIGAVAGTANYFRGDIGWTRVDNTILYNALFTPPPRCYLPDWTIVTTVGQWIGGEVNGTAIDNQEGTAGFDGTLTGGTHLSSCRRGTIDTNLDPEYLCDEGDVTTFIRNAHVRAQPTHMYALDQPAAWGADVVTWSAINLLPPNSVAGDGFYAGITNEATIFYGPFFNLVFDIASAGVYTGTWQYYSTAAGPAWANLDVHDGTDGLENTGVVAVTWEIDTDDWEPININGFTGYWVRFHLTVGHVNPPVQQNRPVYTTAWAFTELWGTDAHDAARPTLTNSVPGDVPALAKIQCILAGEENDTASAGMDSRTVDRLIFGLRSRSRGPDFCAYLNAGDPAVIGAVSAQEPIGIIPSTGGAAATPTVDDTREQGLHVLCADAGASGVFLGVQTWEIVREYAWQYYGQFRLFLRAECTALNGTSRMLVTISSMFGAYHQAPIYTFVDTNPEKLIDLGLIAIPGYEPVSSADVPSNYISISVGASFSNAGDSIKLYGAILLPTDEKVVEAVTVPAGVSGIMATPPTRAAIDSASTLRTGSIRALTTEANGDITGYMLPISAGPTTFQANADQRLWMVAEQYLASGPYWWSPHEYHAKMLLHRVARYRSMRGSR